jgi:signal transduction histidine kinase
MPGSQPQGSHEGLLSYSPQDGRKFLRALVWLTTFVPIPTIIATYHNGGGQWRYLIGSGVILSSALLCHALLLFRKYRTVANTLCVAMLLSAVMAASAHGVRVPGLVGSFVAVAMAGYLLGFRKALIYAAIALVSLWGVFLRQKLGYIHAIEPPFYAWGSVLINLLLVSAIILAIPLRGLLRTHAMGIKERRKLVESIKALDERSRNLESDVEMKTRDLAMINADLERFPLALAHDLRSPLQAISGFVSLLQQGARLTDVQGKALDDLDAALIAMERRLSLTLEAGRARPGEHG